MWRLAGRTNLMVFDVWVIASGVRQVRKDADAHLSTTWHRSRNAGHDAGAQGDRADGEGYVAQEAGESLCSPTAALTTTEPSRPRGWASPRPLSLLEPQSRLSVPLLKRGSDRTADCSRLTPPYPP